MKTNQLALLSLTLSATLLPACGSPPSSQEAHYTNSGPGKYDEKLGEIAFPGTSTGPSKIKEHKAEGSRSDYCLYDVPQETDPVFRKHFLKKLSGNWKRDWHSNEFSFQPDGDTFVFDYANHKAWRSPEALLGMMKESISFKRACVSKELYREDPYDGFRIVELVSDSEEGIVAFGVRLDAPSMGHPYPTLLMTKYTYDRWGQNMDTLRDESELFKSSSKDEASVRIEVYPTKN